MWESPGGEGVRVDSGYAPGNTAVPFHDPLMARPCVFRGDEGRGAGVRPRGRDGFAREEPEEQPAERPERPEFVGGNYDTGLVSRRRA
ncbi:hypothetical protein ACSDR0_40165 [Streptosporangium sp. G11]|uniref:hypothetical protein n=1 Tax=Streptosporangium sp. G11 TaxID=3436926 RepID=UPI003EC03669